MAELDADSLSTENLLAASLAVNGSATRREEAG